jgi:hypothetical protein
MKTFEGLSKRDFIKMLNDFEFTRVTRVYVFNHPLCRLSFSLGLDFQEGKKRYVNHKEGTIYRKFVDVTNYNELIPLFIELKVITQIGDEYFIVKDNLNTYRVRVGLKPLTPYFFNKLSGFSGYKLVKKLK